MPLQADQIILNGKYHIVRLLGEGGMARVWLADELTFGNRSVALKEPRGDLPGDVQDEVAQRYRREVTVCAALEKARVPHVMRAITAEPLGDQVLLALEYMPGGDLAGLLQAHPRGLPLAQAVAIARAVLAALQGAHEHPLEIVHRDVKPSNILFDGQGRAHLGDFGLAQVANTSGSLTKLRGGSVGTPLYAAPEQEKGIGYVTPGADLYALGCVLFEMLTGKRYKRVKPGTRVSSLRADVPVWLDEAVEKALAENLWERWESALAMAAALQAGQRPTVAFDWVTIPAGPFLMGSDKQKDTDAYDDELPQHTLTLVAYRLARVPVTNAQFVAFVQATKHMTTAEKEGWSWAWVGQWEKIKGASWHAPRGLGSDVSQKGQHPVVHVSWHDAQAFCAWAGVRLPSEAEWEKAARGTDGRIYPWGNEAPDANRCNFNMNVKDTTAVGQYPKGLSPYGVLDMAGNVWEWTSSAWGKSADKPDFPYPYDPTDGREDQSRIEVRRVLRGGSWSNGAWNVRSADRFGFDPGHRDDCFGFRVASPGL